MCRSKAGKRFAFGNQLIDSRNGSQQADEPGRTFDDHPAAALLDRFRIANELDRVAQALFRMEENAPSFERAAVPERLGERPHRTLLAFPTPFVLGPALDIVAHLQPGQRPVPMGRSRLRIAGQGQFEGRQRFRELALLLVSAGQIGERLEVPGPQPQRSIIAIDRFRESPLIGKRQTEIVVRLDVIRLQANGLFEVDARRFRLVEFGERQAQVVERLGVIGPDADRLPEFACGFAAAPLFQEDVAQIEIGVGVVGLQANDLAQMFGRFLVTAGLRQRHPEVEPGLVMVGTQPQRMLEMLHRRLGLTLLPEQKTEQRMTLGVFGVERQDPLHARRRVGELALAATGFRERLPEFRLMRIGGQSTA